MKKNTIITLAFLIFISVISSCEKFNENDILGIWISTNKSDTLEFVDNENFYKSNSSMRHDHYDYHLDKDSIEVRYRGILMVLVHPTKHSYELDNNTLTIDFRNKMCYGFSPEKTTYQKQ